MHDRQTRTQATGRTRARRAAALAGATFAATAAVTGTSQALGASSAEADPNNYIEIRHNGAYLAQTCYEWAFLDPADGAEGDYCHSNRPVGSVWRANFRADAADARVTASVNTGVNATRQIANIPINDTGRNWCFELTGTVGNATFKEIPC